MKRISICISTIDDRIDGVRNLLDQAFSEAEYTVIHQLTDSKEHQAFYKAYPSVIFIPMKGKGLSRSRNLALQCATAEWVYLCDDDVSLPENFCQLITEQGDQFPETDIFCFQLQTTEGKPFKRYSESACQIGKSKTGSISSAEIIFKRKAIQAGHIRFDERFGLGTEFISGEEYLMLLRALNFGCRVQYIPAIIAIHPPMSTGSRYTPELVCSKGAIIAARAGRTYLIFNLLYAIRKWKAYRHTMKLTTFLGYIYSGSKRFLSNAK